MTDQPQPQPQPDTTGATQPAPVPAPTPMPIVHAVAESPDLQADLRGELRHRLRNLIAIVIALINDSIGRRPTAAGVDRLVERLRSLEASGFGSDDASCRVTTLVNRVLDRFVDRGDARVMVQVDDSLTTRRQADILALVTHELATNALKYGALSCRRGALSVRWRVDMAGTLHLEWAEQCPGRPAAPASNRYGYGLAFLDRLVRGTRGSISVTFPPGGLSCVLDLPCSGMDAVRGASG